MLVKLGEHPLSFAEDLIAYRTITALKRPVIVRVPGEDKVPYELADAIKVSLLVVVVIVVVAPPDDGDGRGTQMALKGKGFCTRKPVRLEDIEPLQLLAPDKDDDDADNTATDDDDDDDVDNDGDDATPPPAKKKKKQQQQPKPQASSSSSSRHHHHLPFFINVEYHARFVATLSGLACAFASKNDIDRVKELVRFGAKVNAPEGANGGTVLHSAVARSASACVRWLIEEAGADPFVPNAHGTTPFLLAVAVNALSIVRYLHQWATSSKRKDPGVLQRMLHATDHEGASAFVLAMRRDLVSMMVLLNDVLQAPLDAFEIAPPSGVMSLSPLVTAVEYRKPASALRMLVQAGARLSVAQKGDVGLLELAAAQGSVGHVAMLLRLGLAPDARAFRAAARHNHVRILRLLANPKAVPSEEDCPDDYLDCIGTVAWPDYYYDHDDHDDKEEEKEALLHLARLCPAHALAAAVANDSFQAAQELAALRVPRTPALVEAVRGNRLWAVEMLLMLEPAPAAAAWPDWHDTPLTLAVLYRRTDMVALMASRLPLPLLNQPRAYDGRNPLDLALLQAPDGEIAYILLAAGASPTAAAVAKPLRPQPQEEEEHPQPQQQQHHEEERTTKRRRIVVLATTSIILRDSPTTTTPKVKTPLQPPFGAGSPRA